MKLFGIEKGKGMDEHAQGDAFMNNDLKALSRRGFLQKAVAGAAAVAGMGIMSQDANATRIPDNWEEQLPPGIRLSRDSKLRLYYAHTAGIIKLDLSDYSFEQVFGRMGGGPYMIAEETPYIDPAFYMLREVAIEHQDINPVYLHNANIPGYDELMEKNPAINFFGAGIYNYFRYWVHGHNLRKYKNHIEDNFVYSLYAASNPYTAAGIKKSKEEGDRFLKADLPEKEKLAKALMKRFDRMGKGNRESNDPNDPYNRHLVASWSAFMVTVHYDKAAHYDKKMEKIGDITNKYLEKPLRKYTGKIRGPVKYGI